MAELSGLSLRTVQRLERGDVQNPPLRYLVNLAKVLDCDLTDVVEDEWGRWMVFDQRAKTPPAKGHWLPERERPGAG